MTSLVISNIETCALPPKTGLSLSSALIIRLFFLSCSELRLMSFRPEALYVTHFGQVRDAPRLAADLHRLIDAHAELGVRHRSAGERHERLREGISALVLAEHARQGWRLAPEETLRVFALDIELNAQGIAAWLDRKAA